MAHGSISEPARAFKRHETAYESRIEPHPDHAEQFRLSYPDAQTNLAVVDVSAGGLGLCSGFFIPRGMRLTLHVSGIENEQGEVGQALTVRAIVRRCTMTDYKSNYLVGLQFIDASGPDEQALIRTVAKSKVKQAVAVAVGGASGS